MKQRCEECPPRYGMCWCVLNPLPPPEVKPKFKPTVPEKDDSIRNQIIQIAKDFCRKYDVDFKLLVSDSRKKELSRIRAEAMQACRQITGATFEEIAIVFNRSNAGVQQAINRYIEREINKNLKPKTTSKQKIEKEKFPFISNEKQKTLKELNQLSDIIEKKEKKYRRVDLECDCGPTNMNPGASRNFNEK